MKFDKDGNIYIEKDKHEPAFRSCWVCNETHEHLKNVDSLFCCFNCGKYWIKDKFLSDFYEKDSNGNVINMDEGNRKAVEFFRSLGLEEVINNEIH
jgi:hypothetical protein